MKKILMSVLIISLGLTSQFASAQVTNNFNATSNLQSKCTIAITDVALGNIDFINNKNAISVNGTIDILCSKNVSYTIAPDGIYGDGGHHLLRGTGDNKDAIHVFLSKTISGTTSHWSRDPVRLINGIGSGLNQSIIFGIGTAYFYKPSNYDATVTNISNFEAKPDIYSTTITTIITY